MITRYIPSHLVCYRLLHPLKPIEDLQNSLALHYWDSGARLFRGFVACELFCVRKDRHDAITNHKFRGCSLCFIVDRTSRFEWVWLFKFALSALRVCAFDCLINIHSGNCKHISYPRVRLRLLASNIMREYITQCRIILRYVYIIPTTYEHISFNCFAFVSASLVAPCLAAQP